MTDKGDSVIKYRTGEYIFQDSDSAAYVEAYRKFVISKTVNADLSLSKGAMSFRPLDFKLWNPEKIDISKTVKFIGKSSFEMRMEETIRALKVE
ncbi:MAG: hypothetical protein KF816_17405 [Melioribacteraceae bacterium]|nr:hypothetical protein [Melioribacteraceae bacterium]